MAALNYLEEVEPDFRNPLRGGRQRKTNPRAALEAGEVAIVRDRTREPFSPEEWRKFIATFEDERVMVAWLEAQRGKVREFERSDSVKVRRGPGTIIPTGAAAKALVARRQSLGLLIRAYLYTGGSRLGELLTLRWSDVNLDDGYLRIWQHKTDKHKVVPITAELDRVFRSCLRGTGDARVFRFPDGEPIGEKRLVQRAFELGIAIAGLAKDEAGTPRRFSPHSIRHTVKAWLRSAGYSNEKISGLTGHAEGSSEAISRYGGEIDVDALRPMAEDLARIEREGFHDGEAKRYRRERFTA
jgi:integrase